MYHSKSVLFSLSVAVAHRGRGGCSVENTTLNIKINLARYNGEIHLSWFAIILVSYRGRIKGSIWADSGIRY